MREGVFVRKNIDKWKKFQHEPATTPDALAHQFTELVNDLGYARTFYPHSRVTRYLNGLAAQTYLGIYKNKREQGSRFLLFWKTELPLIVYQYRKELLYSLIIFTTFCLMGVFSSLQDHSFIRSILGDRYVEMTEDNIAKGDPFGVYNHEGKLEMFLTIALNNIKVSFMVFVGGFLASAGTIWMLFNNGLMLGSFQTFFFLKDLGMQSVLVIWIHGTLEISAIVIAGGAGLIVGNSILFPGTYSRLHSVKKGTRDGLKVMAGLVPVFIAAAFLEGFITRYSTMPRGISVSILLISLVFILWYFVFYPKAVHRKLLQNKMPD